MRWFQKLLPRRPRHEPATPEPGAPDRGPLPTAEAMLATLLAELDQGVLVLDHQGRVVHTSRSMGRLLGTKTVASGERLVERLPVAGLAAALEQALAGPGPVAFEGQVDHGERPLLRFDLSAMPGGGVLVLARDLSPLRRQEASRRDLVANVSHELRTPLTAIRGAAETLQAGAMDDREAGPRFLARILEQCARLQALLDDLLILARLEGTEPEATSRPVELAALVEAAVETMRPTADERGVALTLGLAPVPDFAGDGPALERLLLNLLDNAIKYNRPGGQVEVRLGSVPGGLVLAVADTGIGIPAADLERIFERFYRVDSGRSRREGGTGLGLAIAKHVVRRHGGTLEVESKLGEGSVFRVRLPAAPAQLAARW